MKKLPPPPPGWNKSVADLMAEVDSGAKQAVGSPELDWARDYERSLLPPGTRYPCEGEIYEALEDFPVSYVTSWAVAFTGGGTVLLHRGERILIRYAPKDSLPIMVYADAMDYGSVEKRAVPPIQRRAASYEGIQLAIGTLDLNRKFRLVSD